MPGHLLGVVTARWERNPQIPEPPPNTAPCLIVIYNGNPKRIANMPQDYVPPLPGVLRGQGYGITAVSAAVENRPTTTQYNEANMTFIARRLLLANTLPLVVPRPTGGTICNNIAMFVSLMLICNSERTP